MAVTWVVLEVINVSTSEHSETHLKAGKLEGMVILGRHALSCAVILICEYTIEPFMHNAEV